MTEATDLLLLPSKDAAWNLAQLLTTAAGTWHDRCALIYDGVEHSYNELERRSKLAASYLRGLGVEPGDRVGLRLPNTPAFVAFYFGILRLGATVVPQNPLLTQAELNHNMDDAQVTLVISQALPSDPEVQLACGARTVAVTTAHGLDLFEGCALDDDAPEEVRADATAVILYTSGTTGRPKGAELTHANLGNNAVAVTDVLAVTPEDVVLGVLPLYHVYGQTCALNGVIATGARVALVSRFDPVAVLRVIKEQAVTVCLAVPTMLSDLAQCPDAGGSLDSIRLSSSGGSALPEEIRREFERLSQAPVFEGYGLSETSPIASFNRRGDTSTAGAIGWPIPGTEMRIIGKDGDVVPAGEVGEIAIRGHNVMKGYWNNPEATRSAIDGEGWFFSGDLGTMDEDGCFRVVGRLKDLIIRGGFNVYPREIEDLLDAHPAVRLAAVIGVPDERLGEEIAAAVVLQPGADASAADLRWWVKERVAPYKYPRYVWIVEQLPTGPTGKILKRLIQPPDNLGVTAADPGASRGER